MGLCHDEPALLTALRPSGLLQKNVYFGMLLTMCLNVVTHQRCGGGGGSGLLRTLSRQGALVMFQNQSLYYQEISSHDSHLSSSYATERAVKQ